MNDRVREAFDSVHAEEELKSGTRGFLTEKTGNYSSRGILRYRRLAAAAACCLLLMLGFGGYRVYFTPTSVVSIDINPSIEMGINRFDRVITIQGYNDDGDRLARMLDIRFLDYARALEAIFASDEVAACLEQGELLSIAVVEFDEEQGQRILAQAEQCTAGHGNASCHSLDPDSVSEAHHAGLSYGKYGAYLELQEYEPDVTTEDIRGMTMRQIQDLLDLHCHEEDNEDIQHGQGHGQDHGGGHGHGCD